MLYCPEKCEEILCADRSKASSYGLTLNVEALLVDDDVGEDGVGVVLGVEYLAEDDVRQFLGHRLPLGRVHVHVEVDRHAVLAVSAKHNKDQ